MGAGQIAEASLFFQCQMIIFLLSTLLDLIEGKYKGYPGAYTVSGQSRQAQTKCRSSSCIALR